MARYRIGDTIVDTSNATQSWDEETDFDGRNHISRATGSQWDHQTLYRGRRGRYYIEHWSQWEGSQSHVEWISPEEATRWLLRMEHEIPDELKGYVESVSE
jgi:hypothetical protein